MMISKSALALVVQKLTMPMRKSARKRMANPPQMATAKAASWAMVGLMLGRNVRNSTAAMGIQKTM